MQSQQPITGPESSSISWSPKITLRNPRLNRIRTLFVAAGSRWSQAQSGRNAAAISFYAILSLAPMLVLASVVAGEFFGFGATRAQVLETVQSQLGEPSRKLVESLMDQSLKASTSNIAAAFSLLLALWGSNGLFSQIRESIDDLWGIRHDHGGIVKSFFMGRLFSAATALLFVSLLVAWIAWDAFRWQSEFARGAIRAYPWLSTLWSMAFLFLALATLYRTLPVPRIRTPNVWLGAFIGALGLTLLRSLLGTYFRFSSLGAVYGTLGAVFAILLWTFYSSQVFLFGAALVWAKGEPEPRVNSS
ncbi:MAG: YihY/virulence factor BrkB family protein [Armatimonadetes bacterium]|nr:YihY/virulence factor BrkB family protein [Armatimonadota bacterium]